MKLRRLSSIAARLRAAPLLLLAAMLGAPASSAVPCDDNKAGIVLPEVPNSDTVLIFVHGLGGHPRDTWRHGDEEGKAWHCMLKADSRFSKANFYLYGYPTGLLGDQPSIGTVAERMLDELAPVVERHTQAVFVAHSLGGLVTAQMLMKAGAAQSRRGLLRRTKLVMFYGSPGGGSDAAALAGMLKPALQLKELSSAPVLDAVVSRWAEASISKKGRCIAETKPMGGMAGRVVDWLASIFVGREPTLIVSKKSAFALCGGGGEEAAAVNHLEMVKPTSSQHEAYKALARHYSACVMPPAAGARAATLAGTTLAEQVRLWRQQFDQSLQQVRGGKAPEGDSLGQWLHQPLLHDFVQTPDTEPDRPLSYRRGLVGKDQFLVALRDTADYARNGQLEQVAVAWVKDLETVLDDVEATSRVSQLLQAGRLRNDDLAVVLESSQRDHRWLMLLAQPKDGLDAALLRGLTQLPPRLRCVHAVD